MTGKQNMLTAGVPGGMGEALVRLAAECGPAVVAADRDGDGWRRRRDAVAGVRTEAPDVAQAWTALLERLHADGMVPDVLRMTPMRRRPLRPPRRARTTAATGPGLSVSSLSSSAAGPLPAP